MGRVGLERQIAELIHDQELRTREEAQLLLETAVGMRLGERRHETRGGAELDRVGVANGFAAEADGEKGLAGAGWPEEEHGVAMPWAIQRLVASSRIWRGSIDGWAEKSKLVSSRTNGNWAIFVAISMRRSSRRATSRETRKPSASRRVMSDLAASSSRPSSPSRSAVSFSRSSIPISAPRHGPPGWVRSR